MTIKKIFLIALPLFFLLAACKKTTELLDENSKWILSDSLHSTNVKFIHAFSSLTPALTTGAGPAVVVYSDAKRIVPGSPAPYPMVYGGQFPNTATYGLLTPGQANFYFIMNRITNGTFSPVAGDTVFKNSISLVEGKYYTMFLVDTVPNPKVLVVEDIFTIPDQDKYKARFINLIANPTEKYDVYSDKKAANIFSNVGYKEVKDFIDLPVSTSADTLRLRLTGSTTDVSKLALLGISQRVYTLFSRGKTGVSGRTPVLTLYTNR